MLRRRARAARRRPRCGRRGRRSSGSRLAGSGRGDDAGGARNVIGGRRLVRREVCIDRLEGGRRIESSQCDALRMDHGFVDADRAARPAVDPRRGTVGEQHIGKASLCRTERGRLDPPPPCRIAVAGVVAVGPDEEMESFERKGERRSDLERSAVLRLRDSQHTGFDPELDDHRFAFDPRTLEPVEHGRGRFQRGRVEHHNRRAVPRRRDGCVGGDHDGSAEDGGGVHNGEGRGRG
jgi:hypothetical protein